MSNLSILERNIIHSFGAFDDPESAENTFLSALGRVGVLKAESLACELGASSGRMRQFVRGAVWVGAQNQSLAHVSAEDWKKTEDDVFKYIQERHLNDRAGGNLKLREWR